MAAGKTYEPIATTTLGSATASVTFSNITGSYTDLILISNIKSGNADQPSVVVNINDTFTDELYSGTMFYGTGSSSTSNRTSNQNVGLILRNGGLSTNTSMTQVFITNFLNYSNSTTFKVFTSRGEVSDVLTETNVGLWRSTSAITKIRVAGTPGSFALGSTFTLYGIAAA